MTLILTGICVSCTEPIVEQAEFLVEVENADFIRAAFFDSHTGVVQLRHELAGGLDVNGQQPETYFIRVGGAEESVLKPESQLNFSNHFELFLENGYAHLQDDSRVGNLFGSDLNIKITSNSNQRSNESLELQLGRVPEILDSNIGLIPGGLKPGKAITWNSDPLFEGDVYLVAEYFPNLNDAEVSDLYPVGCVEYFAIPDSDGQYVLSMSDFPCIPENSVVFFTFIRGKAMKITSEGSEDDILLAYSTNTSLAEI